MPGAATGKEALLAWCKQNTQGYRDVSITNFTTSWGDGLGFCALIHKFCPNELNFNSLKKENKEKNLHLAFTTAERLGIPALLDVEDMLIPTPEPLSVITYLSQYYHRFGKSGGAASSRGNVSMGLASIALDPNEDYIRQENERRMKENERRRKENEWIKEENERRMKENERRLQEWKKQQEQLKNRPPNTNCAKCGLPLEGETVELQNINKEYHKKCFGCTTCGKKVGTKPILVEENPYCEQCGKKAFILSRKKPNNSTTSSSFSLTPSSAPTPSSTSTHAPSTSTSASVSTFAPTSAASTACPKCGSRETGRFCSTCGTPLSKAVNEAKDKERLQKEQQEKEQKLLEEKLKRERELKEKKDAEERLRKEREEKEKKEREEKEKKERELKEKKEAEERLRKEREEKDKKERELKEKKDAEDRLRRERDEKEKKERELKEKKEAEERARKEREEKEKKEREEKLRKEKEAQEKKERELKEKKDADDRLRREREEKEKKERDEKEKKERELKEKKEAEDKEQERLRALREEQERKEKERQQRASVRPMSPPPASSSSSSEPAWMKAARERQQKRLQEEQQAAANKNSVSKPTPTSQSQTSHTSSTTSQKPQISTQQITPPPTQTTQTSQPAARMECSACKEIRTGKFCIKCGNILVPVRETETKPAPTSSTVASKLLSPAAAMKPRSGSVGQFTDKEAVLLEGYLFKQDSEGIIKRWRKRWFSLKEDQLVYWKSKQRKFTLGAENPPHGSITLRGVSSVEPALLKRENVFKIVSDDVVYYLQAESEEGMMRWIAGLVQSYCKIQYEDMLAKERAADVVVPVGADMMEVKEGTLEKLGRFKNWSPTWVVLKGGVLFFFTKKGGKRKGRFPLYKCTLEEYQPEENSFCFQISAVGKTVTFRAKDEQEMHQWLNAILKQKLTIEEVINSITIE